MSLNAKAFGLACGILWGLVIFVATVWLLVRGYGGAQIMTLDHFYIGYSYSYVGAVVGAIWGFIDGFIGGWLFAWLYNKLAKV